jgi:transcriptional regulator with XRE-family HTH domain
LCNFVLMAKSQPLSLTDVSVARRIVALREENELTLAELARLCGLSAAYLSRVENEKAAVTLASLEKLAAAFATPVSTFFETSAASRPYALCRRGKGKRVRFRGRHGVDVHLLADEKHGKLMEPILVEVESAGARQPVLAHAGEEFMHIVQGRCLFLYGREEIVLEEGDSIYFDATIDHAVRPIEKARCRLLSVVSSPDYRHHGNITRLMADTRARSA